MNAYKTVSLMKISKKAQSELFHHPSACISFQISIDNNNIDHCIFKEHESASVQIQRLTKVKSILIGQPDYGGQ